MTQGNLFDEPCPRCALRGCMGDCVPTKAPEVMRKRLSKQALAILEVLRKGPASGGYLITIAQRFGARIHDLRNAGYLIEITKRNDESGNNTYELKGEPE